jgi:hypothetical protein
VAGEPVLVVSTRVFRGIARGIQLQVSNQGLVGDEKTGGHTQKEARGGVCQLFLGSLRGTLASFSASSKGRLK